MSDLKSDLKNGSSPKMPRRRSSSQSLFAPVLLIALGFYFLLQNMGMLPNLNWAAAWHLWPVLLIFAGINLIVRQFPRPFGSLLSLLVSIATVTFFAVALLSRSDSPFLEQMGVNRTPEMERETVSYTADGITTAEIQIQFSGQGANVTALTEGDDLISGEVSYSDKLIFEPKSAGTEATIILATDDNMSWFMNPAHWGTMWTENRWQLGLSPDVALDLDLEIGSGPTDLDLSGLELTHLLVEGGSGPVNLFLPDGEYDAMLNSGSGPFKVTVPASGNHTISIDGGSGPLTIHLPNSMSAQVELETGSGPFSPDSRFTRISDDDDLEIWQTTSYNANAGNSDNQIKFIIEQGSGPITLTAPQGR